MRQGLKTIQARDLGQEPYRVLFPLGTVAALVGVLLWPFHFQGWISFYPGVAHAHLMGNAFFGAFIVGFLGTALPRLISANPLSLSELGVLVGLHVAAVASYCRDAVRIGDGFFLGMLVSFVAMMIPRFLSRKDLPPPAFVMVVTGIACGILGSVLGILRFDPEENAQWLVLQKLLSFQGFILLPILGVAGFLIPRFFGMKTRDEFPEMISPTPEWRKQAMFRACVAGALLLSFILEAWGWSRGGPALRFGVSFAFCAAELPLFRRTVQKGNGFVLGLRLAFIFLALGFGLVALYPGYRVAFLHSTFVGGFALITLTVATRVVFGHSGNLQSLSGPNRWFLVPLFLVILGFVTRISGDLWPQTMANHYTYASILWLGGVLFWLVRILPRIFVTEPE